MLLLLAENGSLIHRYSGARTVENLAEFARVRARGRGRGRLRGRLRARWRSSRSSRG